MCNNILRPEPLPASSRFVATGADSSPRVGAGSASGQNSRSNVAQAAPAATAVETNVDFILDQIGGMRTRESTAYSYQTYLRARIEDDDAACASSLPASAATSSAASCWFQPSWREQICEWYVLFLSSSHDISF